MSWWFFGKNAISTPKKEKTKQEIARAAMKSRFMCSEGETRKPIIRKAVEVNKPLTTPIKALPMTMEYKLMGDIKHSSNE
jgi:hypothetical protein